MVRLLAFYLAENVGIRIQINKVEHRLRQMNVGECKLIQIIANKWKQIQINAYKFILIHQWS